jgi:3-dehydroquinate dehydratase
MRTPAESDKPHCITHRSLPLAPAVNSVALPVVAVRMSPVKQLTVLTWRGTARLMSHCCTVLQEQLQGACEHISTDGT